MKQSKKFSLYCIFFALQSAFDNTEALHSDISSDDVIEFLAKGHVLLKNVIPELREVAVMEEHELAKIEASKAYERYTIDLLECDEDGGRNFTQRIEDGDGAHVLKECIDLKLPSVTQNNERNEMRKVKKPFYQLIDLHDYSERINAIATGKRFASIAADLLQVEKVRLYQTRTFRKVPSKDETMRRLFNHPTYMHADLNMVPLDTNEYFTIWCPTRDLTDEDSVLTYASNSHRDHAKTHWYNSNDPGSAATAQKRFASMSKHRQMSRKKVCDKKEQPKMFSFQIKEQPMCKKPRRMNSFGGAASHPQSRSGSRKTTAETEEVRIQKEFKEINDRDTYRYNIELYDNIKVGDCVAHHGWLLHGSTSQVYSRGPRDALAFSYIDGNARKLMSKEDRHSGEFLEGNLQDQIMFQKWYYDVPDGEVADHPSLAVVWPQPEIGGDHGEQNATDCDTCNSDLTSVEHM